MQSGGRCTEVKVHNACRYGHGQRWPERRNSTSKYKTQVLISALLPNAYSSGVLIVWQSILTIVIVRLIAGCCR